MAKFATFDQAGLVTAFYDEDFHGQRMVPVFGEAPEPTDDDLYPVAPIIGEQSNPDCKIPAEAIEITHEQWDMLFSNQATCKWVDGKIVEYALPIVEPVTVLPAVTLWERMTEAEAEQVAEVMATQPFRTRKIFETAATFRSDHELWSLLRSMATQLFGEVRAAELLAS